MKLSSIQIMKLSSIILEQKAYLKDVEGTLEWLASMHFKDVDARDIHASANEYSGGRPDSDPRKDKGFASITFTIKDDLDEKQYQKFIDALEEPFRNFKVTGGSRYYDYEPGERDYYPTVKVDFPISEHDKEHPDHPANQPRKPIDPRFAAKMKRGDYGSLD